ncbi:MAG: beta,beta-carotene 9,10-dioxygenase [Solirubrobacterales bacterium]|jgi:carotenoid cleavage dioxygenase-like enzyme|nr:beta,beta-carotene 9,10-dioxygenase [Solirubrobacterales bacterium]
MHVTAATPATASPALGFESMESEVRVESLPLTGELPEWLTGSLVRTGPAKWEVGDRSMNHWFDGLAMLHRFGFADGDVSYASRFLETRAYRAAAETGEITYSEFATDPCRSLFQRVMSLFSPKISDNANVNLVKLGERFVAMTETPIPVQFDGETLETAEVAPWKVPGLLTTAHPHLDRAAGGMLNYAAALGPRNQYRFFRLGADATEPEVIAKIPVKNPAYMHSFGLTARWIVMAEFPFVVNPLKIALSGRPYIENYRWKPELGTRFTLVDRATGELSGPFETDAFFGFHHVNAYEDGDEVVVDVCVSEDAQLIEDFYLERLRAGQPASEAHLRRFTLRPATAEIAHRRLVDGGFELPRINYGRCNERPYRYAWGVANGDSGWMERIVKADLVAGETSVWAEPGCFPGEPVFVAEPGATDEDQGVLLSVVLDSRRGGSFLLVLDAATLDELARAEAPHHIPFGFHGQFAR